MRRAELSLFLVLTAVLACVSLHAQEAPATVSRIGTGNVNHIPEGDETLDNDGWLLVVELAAPLSSTVHIRVENVGGSATPGTDYEPVSAVFEFAPGVTQQFGRLKVYSDIIDETNETIVLRATQDGQWRREVTVTIDDDDTNPTASISPSSMVREELGEAKFQLTVSSAGKVPSHIEYRTVDGTAKAGEDYLPAQGSVDIPAGSKFSGFTIFVRILADADIEPDETFSVQLFNAVNLYVVPSTATVTLVNNDQPAPPFSISTPDWREGDVGTTTAEITIQRETAGPSPVTVVVQSTDNGDAVPGIDYAPLSETVTFAPGVTELTIPATIFGDLIPERDETFEVAVTEDGAVRATRQVTILDDDDTPNATLTIADAQVIESDDDSRTASFIVSMSGPRMSEVRVEYQTVAETALPNDDYTPVSGTLVLHPGETSATITVPIAGDGLRENVETFRVDLTNAVGAFLADASAVGTIVDDEKTKRRSARH